MKLPYPVAPPRAFPRHLLPVLGLLCLSGAAGAGTVPVKESWVTTWATAQPMFAEVVPAAVKPPKNEPRSSPTPSFPASLSDQTVRMIVRAGSGGRQARIQLSNLHAATSVLIAAAHIAHSGGGASIIAGSDRTLTFGGRTSVAIPSGATVISDPVNLVVQPAQDLAISLYLPRATPTATVHPVGLRTTYVLAGNATAAQSPRPESRNLSYFWLSAVDALAQKPAAVIAAFGDSITDGFATTPDRNRAWPSLLDDRLREHSNGTAYSVVNLGISGNRVLHDGAGANALSRFDRDVLALAGTRWVVLLEGINDITYTAIPGFPQGERVTSEDLIAGYRMLIARAHVRGLKVIGATLLPFEGVWTYTAAGELVRQRVNEWIRTSGEFDATVDFDRATRDPEHVQRLKPQFDSGDHVHPNDAGNMAMAQAFDLAIFK